MIKNNIITDPIFNVHYSKLDEFMNGDKNVYLTYGAVGDLLLLIAVCCNDKKAHVVYMADIQAIQFAKRFLDFFNVKNIIYQRLIGNKYYNSVYNVVTNHSNFTSSAHLPDKCDWNDWMKNTQNYKNRLSLKTNWSDLIGIKKRDKKYVIICPSGSWNAESKKRCLSKEEYQTIVKIYLEKGYEVITASNKKDFEIFGIYPDNNCYWLTDSEFINNIGLIEQIDFNTFLQIIISCDDLVSMDTWIKTFMALCDKPAHVIKTRFNSEYKDIGYQVGDYIFLNTDFWPKLKIHTYEDFIEYIKCLPSEL
jgi:hypothetical protein